MNTNVLNAVSPPLVAVQVPTLSNWSRRIKSLFIASMCAALISIAIMLTAFGDRRNGSAVFEFATPCNDDASIECLYVQWPAMSGAARVAIPFVNRRIEIAMPDEREYGQLLNREYERACLEALGVFCR